MIFTQNLKIIYADMSAASAEFLMSALMEILNEDYNTADCPFPAPDLNKMVRISQIKHKQHPTLSMNQLYGQLLMLWVEDVEHISYFI